MMSWTAAADSAILPQLLALHAPAAAPLRIVDVTANRGKMWEGTGLHPLALDVDPAQRPRVVADCRALPLRDGSVHVLVFDPPHIPGSGARHQLNGYANRYGLGTLATHQGAVVDLFAPFLAEAARVLVRGGIVLAKLANPVYWDARRWHSHEFWAAVGATPGLRFCDEVVKVRDTPMPQPHAAQYHSLSAHSVWMVARKGGCQGPGLHRAHHAAHPQQAAFAEGGA